MKTIFNIAKSELRYYYYSPVAWFLMILFLFVFGGALYVTLANIAIAQDASTALLGDRFEGFSGRSLTGVIFNTPLGLLFKGAFIFIPLLTMNLINKEYAYGSIKLLNSSPISIRQIVMGKYVGIVAFLASLFIVFAVFCLFAGFFIDNLELAAVLSIIAGFMLAAIVYAAIGMFLSSVTAYPIFAALLTFTVLYLFSNLHDYFQKYNYIGDAFYFLSIGGRLEKVLNGLISTRDLLYCFSVAGMFIAFTIINIKGRYELNSWKIKTFRYGRATLIVTALLFLSSIPGYIGYFDATRLKTNTIHQSTQEIIKELDGSPIKVTYYSNVFNRNFHMGLPQYRNMFKWEFWEKYLRFYPNITYDNVYYYDVKDADSSWQRRYPGKSLEFVASKTVATHNTDINKFLKPEEIRKRIDFSTSEGSFFFTITYKNKSVIVRTYPDSDFFPDDIHMSAAFQYLTTDTMPRLKFLSGHFERSPFRTGSRDYFYHIGYQAGRSALVNYNILADTIDAVNPSTFNPEDVLVIVDPKVAFEPALLDSIKAYIDAGNNAIIFNEPNKQDVVNPVLSYIGLNAAPGTLVWKNPQDLPSNLFVNDAGATPHLAGEPYLYYLNKKLVDSLPMMVNSVTHLEIINNTFKVDTLLRIKPSNFDLWSERGMLVVDSAAPSYDPHEHDYRQDNDYLIAAQLSRTINGKEQRLIVMSDGDFMSALRKNGQFIGNGFYSYVLNNKYPAYTNVDLPLDTTVKLKPKMAGLIKIVFVWVIPSCLLVFAVVFLIRRKRK